MPRLLHHISVRYRTNTPVSTNLGSSRPCKRPALPSKHPFEPHPNQKLLKTHPKLPQIYTYLN